MGFINLRGFKHAIAIAAGQYDRASENAEGEVSHFQATATALSGTVGLGNISGAAIAIQLGGPGAIVWMTVAGFLGMSSRFVSCTLSQKYRQIRTDGTIAGGPMFYLTVGLAELGFARLGKVLAVIFALLCVAATLGAADMFQANQSFVAIASALPAVSGWAWLYGLLVAAACGITILGGISRIGTLTSRLLPTMAVLYIFGCLWIVVSHIAEVPSAIATILRLGLSPQAAAGGLFGVILAGLQRGLFSSAVGIGSASIAHAATRTDEPIREGIVATIEPIVDTVIICNLTGLTIVMTGVTEKSDLAGIELASAAFGTVVSWFPLVLAFAVFLFAFSTLISWSYYGEKAWTYVFGEESAIAFKILFVISIFVGSVVNLGAVLLLSDITILAMAFPNLLGGLLLSEKVAADLRVYWHNLQHGEFTSQNTETEVEAIASQGAETQEEEAIAARESNTEH